MCDYIFEPSKNTSSSVNTYWSCPHESVSENRCIFHMTEDMRSKNNINQDDIIQKLTENLKNTEKRNEYIGSNLPKLSFTEDIISESSYELNLAESNIDGLNFEDIKVENDISLDGSTIGRIDTEDAVFDSDVSMKNCIVSGEFYAHETNFNREMLFDKTTFKQEVKFLEVTGNDVSLNNCTFKSAVDLTASRFTGRSNTIDDNLSIVKAEFLDKANFTEMSTEDVDMHGSTFHGEATFESVNIDGDIIINCEFYSDVSFKYGVFNGECNFGESIFSGKADFEGTKFMHRPNNGSLCTDFNGAIFKSECIFKFTTFSSCGFSDVVFQGSSYFQGSTFIGSAIFDGAEFKKTSNFTDSKFKSDADFKESVFRSDAVFEDVNFNGDGDITSKGTTFNRCKFNENLMFSGSEFSGASFSLVEVSNDVDLSECHFSSLSIELISDGAELYVDMHSSTILDGIIELSKDSIIPYDLTKAKLGTVSIKGNPVQYELLDYFRICLTEFESFNFSNHNDYFSRNNWNIHTFNYDNLNPDVKLTFDKIEETYLKAKNNAKETGNRKAATEFEFKRNVFNRRKNLKRVFDKTEPVGILTRISNLASAAENIFMEKTCGYGSRLSRVGAFTILTPFVYAFIYWLGGTFRTTAGSIHSETPLLALGENIYYSFITFTSVGYGNNAPIGIGAKAMAASEGVFGGVVIALLIYTLSKRVDY